MNSLVAKLLGGGLFCVVLGTVLVWLYSPTEVLHNSHTSPDGRWVVEVYALEPVMSFVIAPGSGFDADTVIYLKRRDGMIVKKWSGEIIQSAGPILWHQDGVEIGRLFFEFAQSTLSNGG